MKAMATRFYPGQDLKLSLKNFVDAHQLQAGFILTAVGSLQQATIRFANQNRSSVLPGKFEIISLTGTLSIHGLHLHIGLADASGQMIGGHLDRGCLIYTTAEIVIGAIEDVTFQRVTDPQTGFLELQILPRESDPVAPKILETVDRLPPPPYFETEL